jgi:hypothetical protein
MLKAARLLKKRFVLLYVCQRMKANTIHWRTGIDSHLTSDNILSVAGFYVKGKAREWHLRSNGPTWKRKGPATP